MYGGWLAFVLLLGAVLGFAAGKFDRTADAQAVDNKTTRWLAGAVTVGQSQDVFVLFDAQTNRLLVYGMASGGKRLELVAVREISYDDRLVSYGEQRPEVKEVKKLWEEFERAEREKKEEKK